MKKLLKLAFKFTEQLLIAVLSNAIIYYIFKLC